MRKLIKNELKSDRLLYKATALDASANTSAEQPIIDGSHSSNSKGIEKVSSGKKMEWKIVTNKQYAYEVINVELLPSKESSSPNGVESVPSSNEVSLPLAKLLQNVEKSYDNGKKLLEESKITDESNELLFRDLGETGDIWSDMSMGFEERMTAAATRLSNNHAGDKRLKNDCSRPISFARRLAKNYTKKMGKSNSPPSVLLLC